MRKISVKIGVTAVFALALFALSISQASTQEGEGQGQGQGQGEGPPQVDCGAGESIQAALDSAVDGDTINVSGICNEAITIAKNGIRLIAMPGAEIIAPAGSDLDAVRVRALNVLITGFSAITGESRGILVQRSGSATIRDNTIMNSVRQGIRVGESSSARINNNTVTNNGNHGIFITDSSFARVDGNNMITSNARIGIIVSGSSHARIFDNTITGNLASGILLASGGSADIDGNVITDNAFHGIEFFLNSSARLARSFSGPNFPNTLKRNGRFGVLCQHFSALQVRVEQVFGTDGDINASGNTSITDCAVSNPAKDPNF